MVNELAFCFVKYRRYSVILNITIELALCLHILLVVLRTINAYSFYKLTKMTRDTLI